MPCRSSDAQVLRACSQSGPDEKKLTTIYGTDWHRVKRWLLCFCRQQWRFAQVVEFQHLGEPDPRRLAPARRSKTKQARLLGNAQCVPMCLFSSVMAGQRDVGDGSLGSNGGN